jgi:hypothetical protein
MGTNEGSHVIAPYGSVPFIDAPWSLVNDRFADTIAKAEEMLELLTGQDGQSGYMGDLQSAILAAPSVSVSAPSVDTNVTLQSPSGTLPTFNSSDIDAIPTETYTVPTPDSLPSIDTTGIDDIDQPASIDPTFTWSERNVSTDIYTDLLARIVADLQSGATGLDATVEQAIFDRAKARQLVERTAEYNKLNNDIAARGLTLPSGVLISALTDFTTEANRQDTDINNQIIVTQGELAQKNSQFIIQQATILEELLRKSRDSESDRELEYKKAGVQFLIQDYSERVRGYIGTIEGQKAKIQAQVEALKGVIEKNKGEIDIYVKQYDAYSTRVNAIATKNKAVTDVYTAQVQGYGEGVRAVSSENESTINLLKAKIQNAELEVRAAISTAEETVRGYTAEASIKERVASDLAQIAAQATASWASAVNASAQVGYSGSESRSESFGTSSSLSETHSYQHDPTS